MSLKVDGEKWEGEMKVYRIQPNTRVDAVKDGCDPRWPRFWKRETTTRLVEFSDDQVYLYPSGRGSNTEHYVFRLKENKLGWGYLVVLASNVEVVNP